MTWEIFVGISALVGFFISVVTPVVKLNTSIIKLTESVTTLREALAKLDSDNEQAHGQIEKNLEKVNATIKEHNDDILTLDQSVNEKGVLLNKLEIETTKQEHRLIKLEMQVNQWEKELLRNSQRIEALQEKMRG